jgi:BirA family biotin operon repressor/biotin-[acetyl-CoA-carboxylase] ligase
MEKPRDDRVVVRLDETLSTNAELKRLQKENPLPEFSMVMTEFQTAGRGQAGNSWHSAKGNNILLSFLLYPNGVKAKDQFIISQIVSLAIKRVLDNFITNVTIKWPNDIYWKDKKIAGILIENSLMGQHIDHTIVGVGLNINEKEFPEGLPNPISLRNITKEEADREILLTLLQSEFLRLYQAMERGEIAPIVQKYMRFLYHADGPYWYADKDGRFKATIKRVLPSGHLVLATFPDEEERTYSFKEVSFEV